MIIKFTGPCPAAPGATAPVRSPLCAREPQSAPKKTSAARIAAVPHGREFDSKRVNALRIAVAKGCYVIDPVQLAVKLLAYERIPAQLAARRTSTEDPS